MSAVLQPPSHDELFFVQRRGDTPAIPELTRVVLLEPVKTDEGETIPAGLIGTVVGVMGSGEAYDVELTAPVGALVTVRAQAVRPV